MSQELFYTSAPRGLQPGSRGFCTVAMTQGLPGPVLEKLEQLSGYRALFPPHDPKAALNPVVHMHVRLTVGGRTLRVLSRVCAAGLDYTQRANTFAHHVVLDAAGLPPAGPAWLAARPGFLEDAWDGEVRLLPAGRTPPRGDAVPGPCRAWEEVTRDAGWAGVLAEAFLTDPNRPAYLLFDPGLDPLPLLAEAIALLPPERRWDVTFSTYFTGLPQGVACAWRCVLRGSAEAKNRPAGALVVPLSREAGAAPEREAAEAARQGEFVPAPAPPEPVAAREPTPVAAGRYEPMLRAVESARPGVALESRPAAPPPGAVQPPWPAPGRGKPHRAPLVWGLVIGLLAGLIPTGLLAFLWYSEVTSRHADQERNEAADLLDEFEKLKKRLAEKEDVIASMRAEIDAAAGLRGRLADANRQLAALGSLLNELGPQLASARNEIAKLKSGQQRVAGNAPPPKPPARTEDKIRMVHHGIRLPEPPPENAPPAKAVSYPPQLTGFTLKPNLAYKLRVIGLPAKVPQSGLSLIAEQRNQETAIILRVSELEQVALCKVQRTGDDLVFRWVDDTDLSKRMVQSHHQYIRNLVIEIHAPGEPSQFVALREPVNTASHAGSGKFSIDWGSQRNPAGALLLRRVVVRFDNKDLPLWPADEHHRKFELFPECEVAKDWEHTAITNDNRTDKVRGSWLLQELHAELLRDTVTVHPRCVAFANHERNKAFSVVKIDSAASQKTTEGLKLPVGLADLVICTRVGELYVVVVDLNRKPAPVRAAPPPRERKPEGNKSPVPAPVGAKS